jgi:hypothetical protein
VVVNCKTRRGQRMVAKRGPRRVFLDGVEIKKAWYTDVRRAVVRTYDVMGNGKPRLNDARTGVLSKELRGKRLEILSAGATPRASR